MRKSLAILIIITLLSGYGIYWANATIGAEVDNVQLTEHAIYGDKSVVDGVTIQRNTKYDDYMYWNTTYNVGKEAAIDTDFAFYEFGKDESWEDLYGGIWFDNYSLSMDYDENTYAEAAKEELVGLNKALYELVEAAPAGKTTTKTVNLQDYEEYYTFRLQVDLPGVFWDCTGYDVMNLYSEQELKKYMPIIEKFNEFFRIPVLEDEVYCIGVNKDDEGNVIGYGYTSNTGGYSANDYDYLEAPDYGDSFIFDLSTAYTEDTCYFTFLPMTYNGNAIDTSLIPGGYGVYSFQYDSKKETFDADSLKLEYALEPGGYVGLEVDAQQENLLVFTEDEEQFYLQVVDLDTMEVKQQIAYGKMDENNLTRCYFVYEDYLIAQYDYYEAMIFSRNADGTYTEEYTIPAEVLEASEEAYFLSGDCSFDWDGEKLLVADSLWMEEPYYEELCGFYLAAFDETGLLYYGEYTCSLDTGLKFDDYTYGLCNPVHNDSLTISWK